VTHVTLIRPVRVTDSSHDQHLTTLTHSHGAMWALTRATITTLTHSHSHSRHTHSHSHTHIPKVCVRAEWEYERDRSMTTTRLRAEAQASDALTRALINAASRGERPRCGDAEVAWMFLDEDPRHRAIAATYRAGCPVFEPCDEVGRHQTFGTYASKDRTVRPGRRKEEAA
jgi:hypothetical protein